MNAENFSQYIENPSLLYQMNYEELKQLILQYPFNANLRYLLVKKSQQEEHRDFERNLKAAAINSPDRKHLYNMLHEEQVLAAEELEERLELKSLQELDLQTVQTEFYQSNSSSQELAFGFGKKEEGDEVVVENSSNSSQDLHDISVLEEEIETEVFQNTISKLTNDTTSIVEDTNLSETEKIGELAEESRIIEEDRKVDTEEPPSVVTVSKQVSEIMKKENIAKVEESNENESVENENSMEFTIETEEQEQPILQPSHRSQFKSWRNRYKKPHYSNVFESPRYDTASLQVANQSIEDSDELVTETLADLLIKQKRFHKAIEVYQQLSLQFPEKSNFFASRIEEIRALME